MSEPAIQTHYGELGPPVIWNQEFGFTAHSPMPDESYEFIWTYLQQFAHQTLDRTSPNSLEELEEKLKADVRNGGKTYAFQKEDGWVGGLSIENVGDGIGLGHLVFSRDNQNLTTAEKLAMSKAAIDDIFQDGFRKIQWAFFSDNRAFRLFLRKLGATHEGTLKAHVNREGEWVDADMMASFPRGEG